MNSNEVSKFIWKIYFLNLMHLLKLCCVSIRIRTSKHKLLFFTEKTLAKTLDISKVFAMVWHKILLAKLTFFGLAPKLCKLFESFLSDRCIKVVIFLLPYQRWDSSGIGYLPYALFYLNQRPSKLALQSGTLLHRLQHPT